MADREPVMAAEVLAEWYALLRSAYALLRTIDRDDPAYGHLADDIDAALAPYPTSHGLPSSGGPVVVGTDGTVRDYPELTEEERAVVEHARWVVAGLDREAEATGQPCLPNAPVRKWLTLADRLAPPAQDAENQEDKP